MRKRLDLPPLPGEIINGHAGLSDLPKWHASLTEGKHSFSEEEFDDFYVNHLLTVVEYNYRMGMSEEECYRNIYNQMFSDGQSEPTEEFEPRVRLAITESYAEYRS